MRTEIILSQFVYGAFYLFSANFATHQDGSMKCLSYLICKKTLLFLTALTLVLLYRNLKIMTSCHLESKHFSLYLICE